MNSKEDFHSQQGGVVYMTIITAQKWGNSLGIRIPKDVTNKLGIDQGSELELTITDNENTITLKPKQAQKHYSLNELLSQITPENRHEEIDMGTIGRELL